MITIEKLYQKPSLLLSFTGLTLAEFQKLLGQMALAEAVYKETRLSRTNRQRALGGGRHFTYQLAEQLLMLLMYYRLYCTYTLLGFMFDVDETTILRNIVYISPLMTQFLPLPEKIIPAISRIKTMPELLQRYPELKVIIDATEQSIPRPKDKDRQQKYYSGKKKRHTIKTQITNNKMGLILNVFGGIEGKRHDFQTFQDSGIDRKIPPGIKFEVDLGYLGIEKAVPERGCLIPFKASKYQPLTPLLKIINKSIAQSRILAEHVLSWLKKFRIIKETFRNRLNKHPQIFNQIAGIVNLRTMNRLELQWD